MATVPTLDDRRAELARTAYEMIAESGVDALSLRALARRLGATTGLVSHHFVDRSELVHAALDHAAQVIVDHLGERAAADAHPLNVLQAVLPTSAVTKENWRFALSIRGAALSDPDFRTYHRRIAKLWARYLPAALESLAIEEANEAAEHLVVVLDGIALRAVLDPKAWPARRQLAHMQRAFDALAPRTSLTQGTA